MSKTESAAAQQGALWSGAGPGLCPCGQPATVRLCYRRENPRPTDTRPTTNDPGMMVCRPCTGYYAPAWAPHVGNPGYNYLSGDTTVWTNLAPLD